MKQVWHWDCDLKISIFNQRKVQLLQDYNIISLLTYLFLFFEKGKSPTYFWQWKMVTRKCLHKFLNFLKQNCMAICCRRTNLKKYTYIPGRLKTYLDRNFESSNRFFAQYIYHVITPFYALSQKRSSHLKVIFPWGRR